MGSRKYETKLERQEWGQLVDSSIARLRSLDSIKISAGSHGRHVIRVTICQQQCSSCRHVNSL